jgi:hypothetical protein
MLRATYVDCFYVQISPVSPAGSGLAAGLHRCGGDRDRPPVPCGQWTGRRELQVVRCADAGCFVAGDGTPRSSLEAPMVSCPGIGGGRPTRCGQGLRTGKTRCSCRVGANAGLPYGVVLPKGSKPRRLSQGAFQLGRPEVVQARMVYTAYIPLAYIMVGYVTYRAGIEVGISCAFIP